MLFIVSFGFYQFAFSLLSTIKLNIGEAIKVKEINSILSRFQLNSLNVLKNIVTHATFAASAVFIDKIMSIIGNGTLDTRR